MDKQEIVELKATVRRLVNTVHSHDKALRQAADNQLRAARMLEKIPDLIRSVTSSLAMAVYVLCGVLAFQHLKGLF